MKKSFATIARLALVGIALLTSTRLVPASEYYATPSGAGAQNGTSWANAYTQAQIQAALDGLQAGDTLNLGSGTYTLTALTINGSGTAGNPKTLLGVDTGGGLPLFQGNFNVNNNANGARFITFPSAATVQHWVFKDLSFKNHPFVIAMLLSGTTDTLRSHITFENLAFDSIEDCIRLYNANNILVKNCTAVRYTKKAFRIGDYTSFVTYQNCYADCTGGDPNFPSKAIPVGFGGDDTAQQPIIHDIDFIDCISINNGYSQSSGSYWNGDGFSTERGTYNVNFIRCIAYGNNDGGFDNKASYVTYQDCVSADNSRGYRQWADNGVMVNCVASYNLKKGGTGASYSVWISGNGGVLAVDLSTFHGDVQGVIVESGGTLSIDDSIISTNSATAAFTSGSVTLTNTATWRPGSGTDPDYVADSASWHGVPANAMDSQTYGLSKGYNSTRVTGGDTTAPSVPSGLAANSIAQNSFNLTWNASTDNVAVTGYEVFRNGVPVATPSSTSVSVTGLSPNTTYAMTVRARDAAGNWSAQSSVLNVTTASGGGAIRIESANSSPFTDSSGHVWTADYAYDAGVGGAVDRGPIAIANTNDDRIYQTERWGLAGYAIPVANGTYTVNLHFAETYPGITAAGQRIFTVTAEGSLPTGWSNIDIFAEAGGRDIALIKSASITVSDGTLNLGFSASVDNPLINGIEIIPSGSDTTPPSVPTGLGSSNITSSSFTLSWSASTDNVGVTGYEVFRDGVSIATPSGTSVSVTGLSPSTTYAMTVRARDAAGNWSAQSSALNVTTSADSGGGASIGVNLGDGSNALAAGDVVGAVPAANWNNSTANNDTLANAIDNSGAATTADITFGNTAYAYTNNTGDPGGSLTDDAKMMRSQRAKSNASSMSVVAAEVPYSTYDVYVYWGGRTPQESVPHTMGLSFQLWDGSSWVTQETKYIRDDDRVWDGTYDESTATSSGAATDGNDYVVFRNVSATTFRVVANTGNRTGLCGLQIVSLGGGGGGDTTAPSVPTGLASSDVTSDSFTLSWTASTDNVGVTGYEVFRDGVSVATPSGTSVSVTSLSASTTYAMTVRARDAAGNWSAQSGALNVTTNPPPDTTPPSVPNGLAATDLTPDGFTLTWNASTDNVGVTGYEIFLDGVSYTTTAVTSVGVTDLSAGTSYAVTVRATDAAGNWSAQSAALNVSTPAGATISVNVGDSGNALAAGEIVGAVPAANWNNSTSNNETLTNAMDGTGTATTADITFGNTAYAYTNNTSDPGAPLTDDAMMMRSQRAKSNASTVSVVASEVPYAAYDIYVYWGGRTPQESVPHTMTLDFQLWDGSTWVTVETKYIRDDDRVWDGTYDESTATTAGAAADGNDYVVFRGVTDVTFRVVATSGVRTGICGLQIVEQ